jgi:hypothetical protein
MVHRLVWKKGSWAYYYMGCSLWSKVYIVLWWALELVVVLWPVYHAWMGVTVKAFLVACVTTHPQWHNIVRFWLPKLDFPGGHPSWDCSRRSTLNCGVLIGSWPSLLQNALCHKGCIYTYNHILIPKRCGTSQSPPLWTQRPCWRPSLGLCMLPPSQAGQWL